MSRSVAITLDRERTLRFDVNAISDLEEVTGKSLVSILSEVTDLEKFSLQIRTMRALLWAGLKHEDPTLSINAAGTLMQKHAEKCGDFSGIMPKVMKAIMVSGVIKEPEKEAGTGAGPADPQPGA